MSLLGVSTYRLLKPYRTALFARTARELDAVAARFARALHGRVAARRTVRVAGQRVRQYDVDYGRTTPLVQRTTFVLRGLREYQLTCRFAAADRERPLDGACARFLETFRLAAPPA